MMRGHAGVGISAVLFVAQAVSLGQLPPPVADRVERPLLPSGISDFPAVLNGTLVYLFKDEDGTEALHFLGDFLLTLGDEEKQVIRANEAVVWLTTSDHEGKPFKHLQIFLYRDAEVHEIGGTITSSPVLFVTLSTYADVQVDADDIAMQSSASTQVYKEGNGIRKAFIEGGFEDPDEDIALRILDPRTVGAGRSEPAPKPVIHFESAGEITMIDAGEGRKLMVIVGGVYLSRGRPGINEYFEIQAQSAVIYLTPNSEVPRELIEKEQGGGLGPRPVRGEEGVASADATKSERPRGDRQLMNSNFGNVEVEAAYLDGDVQLSQGLNMVRASRLFFDFLRERAVILDAVARSTLLDRNVPLYVRANEIRQLSANEITANNAILTTSEFHTPHYHIGARRVDLVNRTPADPAGDRPGIRAGTFRIYDPTFNVMGTPLLWWPYMKGDVASSETAMRSIRTGFSGRYGFELEAKWHLFNLMGLETPEGFDATLSTEFYSKRGPALGVDVEYQRDRYFGLLKSFIIADSGEDKLGRHRPVETPDVPARGRLLFRHRQYLEDDWQVSLELAYQSDRNFLEQFFEREFDYGKEQETLVYLKKQRDNWAFTAAMQVRLMDYLTQTERYPDFSFQMIGEPLGDFANWYSENRLGVVRYRAADQTFWDMLRNGATESSGGTFRADSRQEVTRPFDLGISRFVPFAAGRGSYWTDSIDGGSVGRGFGELGIRGSTYFWKMYPESRSELFDIDGIRHVIKSDITAWTSAANEDDDDLFRFDETVEGIQDLSGVTMGLRQRWQTKRGTGTSRRVVDVFTHDLEFGAFSNADGDYKTNGFASYSRPENSISRNFISSGTMWRVNDRTALLSELNYDVNDGDVDIFNLALAVERTPRFNYVIGYRFIDDADSNLLGFDMNYRLTEKYTLALRELFDLERGETLDFTVAFVRRFPRWYGALSFELDNGKDDFGVSFSLWPEGVPPPRIGSRRFTGLATTTEFQQTQ